VNHPSTSNHLLIAMNKIAAATSSPLYPFFSNYRVEAFLTISPSTCHEEPDMDIELAMKASYAGHEIFSVRFIPDDWDLIEELTGDSIKGSIKASVPNGVFEMEWDEVHLKIMGGRNDGTGGLVTTVLPFPLSDRAAFSKILDTWKEVVPIMSEAYARECGESEAARQSSTTSTTTASTTASTVTTDEDESHASTSTSISLLGDSPGERSPTHKGTSSR
jgi:hypothetical protein